MLVKKTKSLSSWGESVLSDSKTRVPTVISQSPSCNNTGCCPELHLSGRLWIGSLAELRSFCQFLLSPGKNSNARGMDRSHTLPMAFVKILRRIGSPQERKMSVKSNKLSCVIFALPTPPCILACQTADCSLRSLFQGYVWDVTGFSLCVCVPVLAFLFLFISSSCSPLLL